MHFLCAFVYSLGVQTPNLLGKKRIHKIRSVSKSKDVISTIILLPEKFVPFDWLRAEVFQLNLKYLDVKITVTMVTHNHQIISSHELRKNGGKISKF